MLFRHLGTSGAPLSANVYPDPKIPGNSDYWMDMGRGGSEAIEFAWDAGIEKVPALDNSLLPSRAMDYEGTLIQTGSSLILVCRR